MRRRTTLNVAIKFQSKIHFCHISSYNPTQGGARSEDQELVEIQATGERKTFSDEDLNEMLKISKGGIKEIIQQQKKAGNRDG